MSRCTGIKSHFSFYLVLEAANDCKRWCPDKSGQYIGELQIRGNIKVVGCLCLSSQEIDSMLPCICLIIDPRSRENLVRAKRGA